MQSIDDRNLRHVISRKRIYDKPDCYKILLERKHADSQSDRYSCKFIDAHYHYIISFEESYIEKDTRKAIIKGARVIPRTLSDSIEIMRNYIEKYDIAEEEEEPTARKRKYDEITIDGVIETAHEIATNPFLDLDKIEIAGRKEATRLHTLFPDREESYQILKAKYATPMARKSIEADWRRFKEFSQAEFDRQKSIPITADEMEEIKGYTRFYEMIPEIITKIVAFKRSENKIPIIILNGLTNTGKSKYLKIISEAMGSPTFLEAHSLLGDVLAMDTLVRGNHDLVCFEEFLFVNFKQDISKALQALKRYTSGDSMNFRTAKNTSTDGSAQVQIKGVWIATNESSEALMTYKTLDPAFASRIVDIEFDTQIPKHERISSELYEQKRILFTKYAIKCFKEINNF